MVAERKYCGSWIVQKGVLRIAGSSFPSLEWNPVTVHFKELGEGGRGGSGYFGASRFNKGQSESGNEP